MVVNNSPDIQVLDYELLLDVSGATPVVTFTNKSVASNPANLKWVFEFLSPSGTTIHKGTFSAPDINGAWAVPFVRNTNFPKPNFIIEFSGNPYRAIVRVRDRNNTEFVLEKSVRLCKPSGFDASTKTPYGKGVVSIIAKCAAARLWIEDKTNLSYNGVDGTVILKTFKLLFPPDNTGVSPDPVTISNFNSSAIPISQSGPGYQYFYSAVMQYDLGDSVFVRIKYLARGAFSVACDIDLSPIACELHKLIQRVQSANCRDKDEVENTIKLVSARLQIATIGIMHPESGMDPYKEIEEIKKLTGWECDCCGNGMAPMGTIPNATVPFSFDVDLGSDLTGEFSVAGSTVTLHLDDIKYDIVICAGSAGKGIGITPSLAGGVKTYCVSVDDAILADVILAQFETNNTYKQRFITMLSNSISAGSVNVDTKCLALPGVPGGGKVSYEYAFHSEDVPLNEAWLLVWIHMADGTSNWMGITIHPDTAGQIDDAETFLNAAGLGTWEVTWDNVVRRIHFASETNEHDIVRVTARGDDGVEYDVALTKRRVSAQTFPVQTVLQGLINYVCASLTGNVLVGTGLSVRCLSAVGEAIQEVSIKSTDKLSFFFERFIECYNNLVQIVSNSGLDCTKIHSIFAEDDFDLETTDRFLIFVGGKCYRTSPEAIAKSVFTMATNNAVVKELMCKAVAACTKAVCAAVSNLVAVYDPATQKLTTTITNSGALRYRVGYKLSTNGRTDFSGVDTINATNAATTVHEWTGVPGGEYTVYAVAICADGSEAAPVYAYTQPCVAPMKLNVSQNGQLWDVTVGEVPAGKGFRIDIQYPNGGGFVQNYAAGTAMPVQIPIPNNVAGLFVFTAMTVCDAATNWFSAPTPYVTMNRVLPSGCPQVEKAEILSLTDTTVTIRATKPTAGTSPLAYTLRLTEVGGATRDFTSNAVGAYVTWNITALNTNREHSYEIISQCSSGVSDPYFGGRFATQPGVGATANIKNEGATNATSVALMVDGVLVFTQSPLNAGQTSSAFAVANYVNKEVRLKACDAGATTASITVGATVYSNPVVQGDTFIFSNVSMGPMDTIVISFS